MSIQFSYFMPHKSLNTIKTFKAEWHSFGSYHEHHIMNIGTNSVFVESSNHRLSGSRKWHYWLCCYLWIPENSTSTTVARYHDIVWDVIDWWSALCSFFPSLSWLPSLLLPSLPCLIKNDVQYSSWQIWRCWLKWK